MGREKEMKAYYHATTCKSQTFHVSSLSSTQGEDALLGKHIQRQRINTLKVKEKMNYRKKKLAHLDPYLSG
jgi:hypothetical protein